MSQPAPIERSTRQVRHDDTVRVTIVGAVVDFVLALVKIVVGYVAHSQALIADGIHSLSDLVTDGVVLYAAKHAHLEADEEHPYGHGRFETLATVALGMALIGVAVGISVDALFRLIHPETRVVPGVLALVVAGVSVLSKEALYRYTVFVADRHNSPMLRANAWHHRSDALSSVIVLVGVAGSMAGWGFLDAVAAIGVGLMVAKIGWDLAWHSIRELVDTGLDPERVAAIRQSILNVDGVMSLHVLRTRRMAGEALVDVHIQVAPRISVSEGHYISESVRTRVIKEIEEVADVMVHIDPENDEVSPPNTALPLRHELLRQLAQEWQGIDAASRIQDVTLHYLEGRIEVELKLPLAVLGPQPETARDELRQAFDAIARRIEAVSVIRLSFQ
jgi:cation diffusion facilitator family transporter